MSVALVEDPPGVAGRDLALRHRYGDPEAFDEVYARFSGMVFGLALRMSGDREQAADATQEVFLRVYRHLGRFRGRSSLKTWIYRITVNCCRSRLRRRAKRRREGPLEELDQVADGRRGPEERTLSHDLGRRLAAAIAELPVPFREAVVLRDVQGLSYAEIGEVLGIRVGTVRSRIARGRERLRGRLEEEG